MSADNEVTLRSWKFFRCSQCGLRRRRDRRFVRRLEPGMDRDSAIRELRLELLAWRRQGAEICQQCERAQKPIPPPLPLENFTRLPPRKSPTSLRGQRNRRKEDA